MVLNLQENAQYKSLTPLKRKESCELRNKRFKEAAIGKVARKTLSLKSKRFVPAYLHAKRRSNDATQCDAKT